MKAPRVAAGLACSLLVSRLVPTKTREEQPSRCAEETLRPMSCIEAFCVRLRWALSISARLHKLPRRRRHLPKSQRPKRRPLLL